MQNNYVKLIGEVANEVKSFKTKSGKDLARVTIKVTDNFTAFIPCIAWEGESKSIANLKEGQAITIEGHVARNKFGAEGDKHYSTDIVIDKVL